MSDRIAQAFNTVADFFRERAHEVEMGKAIGRPTFSGTTTAEWSAPSLTEILRDGDIADPDTEWADLSQEQKREVASLHLETIDLSASSFDDAVRFPVVEPGSRNLSRNALENAKARARFASDPERLRSVADSLLQEHYDVGKEAERVEKAMADAGDGLGPQGPENPIWMFVTAAPSEEDIKVGKHISGRRSDLFLKHYLDPLGLSRDDVTLCSISPVPAPEGVTEKQAAEYHLSDFYDTVEKIAPYRIVTLGETAKEVVGPLADLVADDPGDDKPQAIALVDVIKNVGKLIGIEKAALDPPDAPMAPDMPFEKGAAMVRLREWASTDGSGDKAKIDFQKFGQAFLARVGEPTNLGSYKLPVADIREGELQIIPAAVRKAREDLNTIGLSPLDRMEVLRTIDELLSGLEKDAAPYRGAFFKGVPYERKAWYIAYPADEIDLHGEFASEEEIEKAAHRYMRDFGHVGKHHEDLDDGHVIESFVAPMDMPDFRGSGEDVKKGDWVVAIQWGEEAWEEVKSGETPGISMGGIAQRRWR